MSNVTKASTAWVFTINNPSPVVPPTPIYNEGVLVGHQSTAVHIAGEQDNPGNWIGNSKDAQYVVWQLEEGDNGTPHYQGYVEWTKPKRLSAVRKINSRAHWEIRRGTQEQAIGYAKKPETRVMGPWEYGDKGKGQGARSDLDSIGREIIEGVALNVIAKQNPGLFMQYGRGMRDLAMVTQGKYNHDDVRGVWYWGGPGTGKSRKAREEYPEAYLKAQNKWFDGYAGEKEIILDDLDKLGGDKLGHYLKIWADRYACTAEVKGSTVNLQHRVIVITSNYHPDTMWPDDEEMLLAIKRRFKITKFANLPTNKKRKRSASDGMDTECPFGCPDTDACMCVQSGRVERQL